ncbi:MAG: MMPL family transporter [Hyphomicrobiales bacterium]|nr:MMPL family transporter [Hyphomicrobiales bacterium]
MHSPTPPNEDRRAPPSSDPKLPSLALGIERLGLVSIRWPTVVAFFAAIVGLLAWFGVERLKVDDSLSQLFRSETPAFRQYEAVTKRFPSSEFDVLVVVEGNDLLKREPLEKLRDLVTDLQLIDGARGVVSIYSARQPGEIGGLPPPLFPETLPSGADFDQLIQRVRSNEIIRGKLLSVDGSLTLVVLSLEPDATSQARLPHVIADVRKTIADDLAGVDLKAELSGVPVMQLEIRNAVERDRLVYNVAGFLAGCLIAILFFRRISFMIVAAGPPLAAILFAIGALGWLGFSLNIFLNVMTPLIMVIGFSDSMQLTFAARDRLIEGRDKREAFRQSILVVGPACVLTHATAAISFAALMISESDLIRTFGEAGLVATGAALVAVLTLSPLLGILLVRHEADFARDARESDVGVAALRAFCRTIATRMTARPGLMTLAGLVVLIGLGAVYSTLQPRYRLADQVPNQQQAVAAGERLDAKLSGSNPIDVLVQFPKGQSLYSPETLDVIAAVHAAVEKQAGVGNVWSLETLRRWLAEKQGSNDVATLEKYLNLLPKHLQRRFISEDQDAALVSGRIPDRDSSDLLPVVDTLDRSLDAVRAAHPGYAIAVTGLAVISARNSAAMIEKLSRGLTIEFAFVAAFIGLAFRSVSIGLATIMPAIFPVVACGALLKITGLGLQFASVVSLIVSFGLGLSATIHFLNRMRLEHTPDDDPGRAIEKATVLVGPAMILTSVVLSCALAMTILSNLPSLKLFGWLSAFSMLAALAADFLILRPSIALFSRWAQRYRAPQR